MAIGSYLVDIKQNRVQLTNLTVSFSQVRAAPTSALASETPSVFSKEFSTGSRIGDNVVVINERMPEINVAAVGPTRLVTVPNKLPFEGV